jgi:hypothetical protein
MLAWWRKANAKSSSNQKALLFHPLASNLNVLWKGVIFRVKVQPGAAKNEIVGIHGHALKIKINVPLLLILRSCR